MWFLDFFVLFWGVFPYLQMCPRWKTIERIFHGREERENSPETVLIYP